MNDLVDKIDLEYRRNEIRSDALDLVRCGFTARQEWRFGWLDRDNFE